MQLSAPAPRRAILAAWVAALLLVPGASRAAPSVDAPDLAPWGATGSYLAGRFAQQVWDWERAASFMDRALAFSPDDPALLRRAWPLWLGAGKADRAVDLARRLMAVERGSHLPPALVAADHLREGRYEAAAALLAEGLPRDGFGQYVGALLEAWTEMGRARPDAARAALAPLAETPGFAPLHDLQLAMIAELSGDLAEAGEIYARIAEGTPSLRTVQLVGGFYERTGRIGEARRLYERFRDEAADPLLAEPLLAGIEDRVPAFPAVRDPRDGLAEALFDLAGALHQERAGELAMLYVRIALHLREDFPLARLMVAEILADAGRHEEAIAEYRHVRDTPGLDWNARLREAMLLDAAGRMDEAAELLRTMAEERPDRIEVLLALGDLHRSAQRYAEAAEAYDAAAARLEGEEPGHWVVYYSRGVSLERSGEWKRAEADLLKAMELNADEPLLLNYLGYSWVDRGENLERALRLIERAVELRPRDGFIVDSLGWALYRLDDFPGAVTHLERAVELQPLDPTINDHLGDAYWQVGRRHEARFQWQRALLLAEEEPLKEQIRAKLDSGLPTQRTADTRAAGAPAGD